MEVNFDDRRAVKSAIYLINIAAIVIVQKKGMDPVVLEQTESLVKGMFGRLHWESLGQEVSARWNASW